MLVDIGVLDVGQWAVCQMMSSASDDKALRRRLELQRSMGLKIEQLKAELKQF